jgi:DNA uptake protein ComE-like DNA-binding protein
MLKIRSQKGTILVLTLWTLAILTIAAGSLAVWFEKTIDQTLRVSENLQSELELASTRATILYLLTTMPFNQGGMMVELDEETKQGLTDPLRTPRRITATGNEYNLAGKPYVGIGKTVFSLQDMGGLVALNFLNFKRMERLLGQLGVPLQQRQRLISRLQDYIDLDDLIHFQGAERKDYEQQKRSAPPNRLLINSWECRNILGWDEYEGLWQNGRLPRLTTPWFGTSVNINTAPLEVLLAVDGMDHMTAERLIKNRPYESIMQASLVAGRPLNIPLEEVATISAPLIRITLWHPGLAGAREMAVRLTPGGLIKDARPWIIEYELNVPVKRMDNEAQPAPSKYFTKTNLG